MRSAYYSICDDYRANSDETWMYADWLYTTNYGIFGHEVKATEEISTRQRYTMDHYTV